MVAYGAATFWSDRKRGIALVTVGSICFIPGSYAVYMMYYALRGTPGYNPDYYYEW
eukprot:CAMPEP_0185844130 /NCGR_PEP_ID=MMETSP1354-20130828/412_1 /TAXON_ID=708628 /ORGANISM="Erythrolobus madagascarensis, Strain CCMP3276" /LENGTH=55 /DNA_ID=CAMNT_0028543751 /DNA_START=399 /DNA_END=566 /DNA_ORIENTATION=-